MRPTPTLLRHEKRYGRFRIQQRTAHSVERQRLWILVVVVELNRLLG